MREPVFTEKFVAFIDVIGFASKVEAAEQLDGAQLSDLLEICQKLENQQHQRSVSIHGPIICPKSKHNRRNLDYTITQISDCAVISTEVSPAGVINLLIHISQTILGLLRYGVMVRGYVTQGNIFHEKAQFIGTGYHDASKGEKLVRAFSVLEDDGATPFVEIDPNVVRFIREETDECVVGVFHRMIKVDSINDITVLFPFQQLIRIVRGNIIEPERCKKGLNIAREQLGNYKDRISIQSPDTDPNADRKSKYYIKILSDMLAELDEIENYLESPKRPGIKLRYDGNLNAVLND